MPEKKLKLTMSRPGPDKSSGHRLVLGMLVFLVLLPVTGAAGALEKLFAPKAELWERWNAQQADDKRRIDHGAWGRFLRAHTVRGEDGIVRVAYAAVSDADRAALDAYISSLSSTAISGYCRAEQLPYWINLYNALTVQTVLNHYPVAGIRDIDISPGFFSDGPWGRKLIDVEGEPISLNDIEHRILRPIWRDPRLHYAVNCASLGCPNLQQTAYDVDNTEALLEQAARDYVNHSRGVRYADGHLVLSSIYSWFEEDFEQDGGVLHIRRYAENDLSAELEHFDGSWNDDYDWSLNNSNSAER